MRITLTLDLDVARMREEEADRLRKTFEQVVNETIRRGLAPRASDRSPPPYRVRSHKTSLRPAIDADALNNLGDEIEDQAIVERMRSGR